MKTTVTQEQINDLLEHAEIISRKVFDKCTIVTVQLANGFVLTESSSCVSPENYDNEIGEKICLERIANRLWELEGYRLQCKLKESGIL